MVHCGFEGTAVSDSVKKPYKLLPLALRGIKTEGPFAPEIDLSKQRPADFNYSTHVEKLLAEIKSAKPAEVGAAEAGASSTAGAD